MACKMSSVPMCVQYVLNNNLLCPKNDLRKRYIKYKVM